MIVGKAGRADTPTDPSPLDMVESVITLRPKEHWPQRQAATTPTPKSRRRWCWRRSKSDELIDPIPEEADRQALLDPATMNAVAAIGRDHARTGAPAIHASSRRTSGRSCCESLSPSWSTAGKRPAASRAVGRGGHRPPAAAIAKQVRADPRRRPGPGRHQPPHPADRREAGGGKEGGTESRTAHGQVPPAARRLPRRGQRAGLRAADAVHRDVRLHRATARRALARGGRQLDREIFPRRGAYDRYAIEELHKLADEKGLWAAGRPSASPAGSRRKQSPPLQRTASALRAELDAAWSAPHVWPGTTCSFGRAPCIRGRATRHRFAQGDGQRGADARLGQHLDPADHQPHRHAGHRRADHDRREGFWQRPGQDPGGVRTGRRGAQADSRSGGRVPRPKPGQRLPGNQDRPRSGGPLRRESRRHSGRDRDGPGRKGDHHDRRRARAIPGAGPLQPGTRARTKRT